MYGPLTMALIAAIRPMAPIVAPPVTYSLSAERVARYLTGSRDDHPRITLWSSREDPYRRGDHARVYFRTEVDAYVTIVRVDTDGRIRALFPENPWEDNFARGGRTFEVLTHSRDYAFSVDDYPGEGYLFAIASFDPFDYDDLVRGDNWDYRGVSDGRVRGDPYVVLTDLAARISDGNDYDYDIAPYYVEQHYDYPRFLCYDCHAYTSYAYWNPYDTYCTRFRIEIYDDYAYYPYRSYGGRRVVVNRPPRLGPRYVFKEFDGRGDYVTRVRERPRISDDRRATEGRTGQDFGGRGSIPAPISPRRRDLNDIRPDRQEPAPDRALEPRRRPQARQDPAPREAAPAGPVDPHPDPGQAEPRREPRREDPRQERPRVEPKPPAPKPSPGAKGTGQPELRRRKPQ